MTSPLKVFPAGARTDELGLTALEQAWALRPPEATADNARDEKDFINHTAFFVQKTYRREIGADAHNFYRHAVKDFFDRYGSEEILAED